MLLGKLNIDGHQLKTEVHINFKEKRMNKLLPQVVGRRMLAAMPFLVLLLGACSGFQHLGAGEPTRTFSIF